MSLHFNLISKWKSARLYQNQLIVFFIALSCFCAKMTEDILNRVGHSDKINRKILADTQRKVGEWRGKFIIKVLRDRNRFRQRPVEYEKSRSHGAAAEWGYITGLFCRACIIGPEMIRNIDPHFTQGLTVVTTIDTKKNKQTNTTVRHCEWVKTMSG